MRLSSTAPTKTAAEMGGFEVFAVVVRETGEQDQLAVVRIL